MTAPDPYAAGASPITLGGDIDLAAARGAFQGSRIAARMPSSEPGAASNWADQGPGSAPPWQTTRRQVGPVNVPMANTRQAKTDPDASQPQPGWAAKRPSRWGPISDSIAGLGSGQPEDAAAVDSGMPATRGDLQEHSDALGGRIDQLQESIGGMQSGGGGRPSAPQNANLRGLTPAKMPPRQAPASPLTADFAGIRAAQQQHAAATSESLAGSYAALGRRAPNQAALSPGGAMAAVQPTGNAMGATTSEASMAGALNGSPMRPSSGIGQSQSSFETSRFGQQ